MSGAACTAPSTPVLTPKASPVTGPEIHAPPALAVPSLNLL
jgi:hypothetical protein